MRISTRDVWLISALLIGLLATSSLAVYYGLHAKRLRNQWESAQSELQKLRGMQVAVPRPTAEPSPAPPVLEPLPAMTSNTSAEGNERIQELEAALAQRDQMIHSLENQATNRRPFAPQARFDRRRRLEELREQDPERYEQIMKAREEARQQVQDAFAKKSLHLLEQGSSDMTEEQQETHDVLLALLAETWELSEKLRTEDLPREERREAWRTMGENIMTLGPMLTDERDREFYQLGLDLGYSEQDAAALVSYLNDVIDVTSVRNLFPSRRGRRSDRAPGDARNAPSPPPSP